MHYFAKGYAVVDFAFEGGGREGAYLLRTGAAARVSRGARCRRGAAVTNGPLPASFLVWT